ncbi:hypothetical protein KP509_33G055200 [Ceratopteris richardii]|uniref:Beta-glucosidase-like SFR2, chloroplastic n=1 Tax=Ceratopteris richardii TaxID=49495 RepID=A0A8T2QR97_CERRI|nr:hypothetical protein KP509_33G055200 [Ceratopteris richardii]KAH7286005.1 hypothetical protein KP509_33G055200 [Ceratopteris richardii]KAH7286008.1 hypothetical protein KP509_33G055200 [Ceratopteris richardii]KAH7286012.1 hypothetical protein KP509_33G055200 [Ceratopteris richardii]
MVAVLLLLNVSKLIGVAGLLGVAANVFSYRRYHRKNLDPFESLLDEDQEILAEFPIDRDVDDGGFFFALATAPAHVEDELDDAWLRFAKETPPKQKEDDAIDRSKESDTDAKQESEKAEESFVQPMTVEGNKDDVVSEQALKGISVDTTRESVSGAVEPSEKMQDDISGNVGSTEENKETESTSPTSVGEWELVNQGIDPEKTAQQGPQESLEQEILAHINTEKMLECGTSIKVNKDTDQSQLGRGKGSAEDPLLQFNLPKKGRRLAKVAMDAIIQGYEKFMEDDEAKPNVAAWHNVSRPEQRLRFWSDPDTEIELAQKANVQLYRMGIDWTRIMPIEPLEGVESSVDWAAVDRYKEIIQKVRSAGMQVMLTLFHHSLPPWAASYGGWKEDKTVDYFLHYVRLAAEKLSSLVDFWITFNEPHVFSMLTYCAGAWPGAQPDLLETVTSVLPRGAFNKAMDLMAKAHLKAYEILHDVCERHQKKAKVGVSHHVSFMRPYGLFDITAVVLSDQMTRYPYIDSICERLDFIGINYYGQEVVSAPGLKLVENDEYSESGRGVYPDGLYRLLTSFHDRYKKHNIPYIVTENGVSDATDYIRRPYLCEHLLALRAAMNKGVPIQGYCFWTTSDNWEWADGYGPKFGLVAVDRDNDLKRIPRPSYYLFSEIAKTGKVTKCQRAKAWSELQAAAMEGKKRPFCRAVDSNGLMYAGGLDIPIERPFIQRDWRFGHYQMDGLQDPVSRLLRFMLNLIPLRRRKPTVHNDRSIESQTETIEEADTKMERIPVAA